MRWVRPWSRPSLPPARTGTCANCGAPVDGAFCSACGQETRLALPTARAFLRDAFGRYVAFDSRMWRTLGLLVSRPGLLTREYLAGRRRRYVRPGRLLLVLALAFFAGVRYFGDRRDVLIIDPPAQQAAGTARPAAANPATRRPYGPGEPFELQIDDGAGLVVPGLDAHWLDPLRTRLRAFNALSQAQKSDQLYEGVLRYGPYAFIAMLPFFALLMQAAYLGRTRRHPGRPDRFAAHLVFGAHTHAFLALMLLLITLAHVSWARTLLWLWVLAYVPWSMKAVYGGPWWGVAARAALIGLAYLFVFAAGVALTIVVAVLAR